MNRKYTNAYVFEIATNPFGIYKKKIGAIWVMKKSPLGISALSKP